MKPENTRVIKKHISNSNLAKTEKWLREQAKKGWKLCKADTGIFYDTFTFIKSAPCDFVYLGFATFGKSYKLGRAAFDAVKYISNTYRGKEVPSGECTTWICIKKSNITDVEDVKKNLQYREKCIKKDYLFYFFAFLVSSLALSVTGFLSEEATSFYVIPAVTAFFSMLSATKLFIHYQNCKKAYMDF